MKTTGVWAATAGLLALLAGAHAGAQSTSFFMANNTAYTVYSVFIWPIDARGAGPDRLGRGVIPSGDVHFFTPNEGTCVYNIRVALQEADDETQWDDVNLCEVTTLTLNYDHMNGNLTASTQ